ncbi:MAG: hypothetical protein DYG89_34635 [Caldilinea sp. CFX5]|nr:hypothetical protein [Caldilinea sp. CFX5]
MHRYRRWLWILTVVSVALLACQPIRLDADEALTLPTDQINVNPCRVTSGHRLGNAPIERQAVPARLDLAGPAEPGERLVITGVVYAADCITPLADTMLEVWQADAAGQYGDLAGTLRTDADGRYELHTVKPGYYAGEANPPPLHIHLRVDHPAASGIETEFFFADDPLVDQDNPTQRQLSVTLEAVTTPEGVVWQGVFPIVLADRQTAELEGMTK